jgi:hypothetical protein
MSARRSIAPPRACSGAMYAAVPRIIPSCVPCTDVSVGEFISVGEFRGFEPDAVAEASIAFANPKSRTFTLPSTGAFTFCGFRSR